MRHRPDGGGFTDTVNLKTKNELPFTFSYHVLSREKLEDVDSVARGLFFRRCLGQGKVLYYIIVHHSREAIGSRRQDTESKRQENIPVPVGETCTV
nr:hypothetical protein CFP56_56072 [Quercus suber]